MSQATHQERAVDPGAVFERYVETDPAVCNACYRRVPRDDVYDGTEVHSKGTTGLVATRADDGAVDGLEPATEHGALYDTEPWDMCPHCGTPGLTSPETTLSIDFARRRAVSLGHRLADRSIPHDWRLLVWFVDRAKRREDAAGKDREIAARAVEFAVSQAIDD